MSNKSSLVPFLTGDEDQNLHVKMVKNSGKPGLNCTEKLSIIIIVNIIQWVCIAHFGISKHLSVVLTFFALYLDAGANALLLADTVSSLLIA